MQYFINCGIKLNSISTETARYCKTSGN